MHVIEDTLIDAFCFRQKNDLFINLRIYFFFQKNFFLNFVPSHHILPQPIYGFTSGGPLRFKRAVGHKDLFYIDDKDLDFKDVRDC